MYKEKHQSINFILGAMLVVFMLAANTAWALPQFGKVVSGLSTISQPNSKTTYIKQTTDKSIINWQEYSIGKDEKVQYFQPDSSSISLNRVIGATPSLIYGQLSANGKIYLINPSGIVFGEGSQVNVGGLVASSLNMADSDFLAGKYTFLNTGNAGNIINQGNISVIPGGIVALIAPIVTNEGTITANGGSVVLGAGNQVTLDFTGDGLISYTVDKGAIDALAENKGLIKADGGMVVMTAKAADNLTSAVVNNSGVIEAQTLENKGGRVMLISDMENGQTIVGGILDASAPAGGDGGFIETSGKNVKVNDGTVITTASPLGTTGTWLIDPTNFTVAAGSGALTTSGIGATTLQTALAGTNTTIATAAAGTQDGDINVNANVTWSANTLSLQAHSDINLNAILTANNTASLDMRAGYSTPGTNGGSYNGTNTVNVGMIPNAGGFSGRVDFFQADGTTPRSGTGFLTINGNGYTVITGLGAQGSTTGTDLQGMSDNLAGYYALGSNIDATATLGWNDGAGFDPVGFGNINPDTGAITTTPFTGMFNGLGHTITNLTINRQNFIGLFGCIDSGSIISNVGLAGGSVRAGKYSNSVGRLVGANYNSTVTNSYNTGNVIVGKLSNLVGGLVGGSYNGTVANSYTTGSVTAGKLSNAVGGLVGGSYDGTVTDSYATGTVYGGKKSTIVGGLVGGTNSTVDNSYATGTVYGKIYVGGLVGANENGTVTNSYATGTVTGKKSENIGGLVGGNQNGTVTNSYAEGTVYGKYNVGGLVGGNLSSTVTNSYATGIIYGAEDVGGLVGGNQNGTVEDSYAEGTVYGKLYVGGLVGGNLSGTVQYSYAIGDVYGSRGIGGLVGGNQNGTVSNTYATGNVYGGSGTGGLVGGNVGSGTIENSYSTGRVTGGFFVGGLVGLNDGTITNSYWNTTTSGNFWGIGGGVSIIGTTGLTDAQMKQQANFSGWNFTTIWTTNGDTTYPELQ